MEKPVWFQYPLISAPMSFQMAMDEVIFRSVEKTDLKDESPCLRFFLSYEPWVTVGYSCRTIDEDYDAKIPICKRLTGGGRVLHGKDLIFSLIAPKYSHDFFKSVRVSYLKIHEAVKYAFEKRGEKTRFYRCDENLPKGNDCFRFPVATDLAVRGEKVAGGSQKRSKAVLLHQESLKIPFKAGPAEMIPDLIEGFEKVFQVTLRKKTLPVEWMEEAEKLAGEKYKDLRTEVMG